MASATSNDFLLGCYDSYFGSLTHAHPASVYGGFTAAMGGGTFAVVGWILYLWSELSAGGTAWVVREAAIATASAGLPVVFFGLVTLLTADDLVEKPAISYAKYGGVVLCGLAVLLFVYAYPTAWNVSGFDYSLSGVTIYGLGIATLLVTTGSAVGCRCAVD